MGKKDEKRTPDHRRTKSSGRPTSGPGTRCPRALCYQRLLSFSCTRVFLPPAPPFALVWRALPRAAASVSTLTGQLEQTGGVFLGSRNSLENQARGQNGEVCDSPEIKAGRAQSSSRPEFPESQRGRPSAQTGTPNAQVTQLWGPCPVLGCILSLIHSTTTSRAHPTCPASGAQA